jgi:hypothetical protein
VRRGFEEVYLLREELAVLTLTERAVQAAGHVLNGEVKIACPAHERVVTYKASTKNYLLPIASFGVRRELPEGAGALLPAFANGVLDVLSDRRLRQRARA